MFDLMNTEMGDVLMRAKNQLLMRSIWMEVFSDIQFKEKILDWIRDDQLFAQGVDENDKIIGTYSEITEMINPDKIAGDHYTLKDTGEFYRSMFIVATADASIIIDADPIKVDASGQTTDLFAEYGDGIIGLTDENKTKLADELIERFQTTAIRILQGD